MINIYTKENCSRCEELKRKLQSKEIFVNEINDKKELMKIGSKHHIMSAPIIEMDNKVYSYEEFVENILL